mmetsp:Transcript_5022/g.18093  ORF Transcript_5022/g.18093 Transcript_5022/m.18093 type:complete len:305 (+) Transcript_5022:2158-3072(+)
MGLQWLDVPPRRGLVGLEVIEDVLPHDVRRIRVVLLRVLHEGPAVHVAHVGLSLAPQQVEAADELPEGLVHLLCNLLLRQRQQHGVPDLLPVREPFHEPVHHRGLPGLCVRVVRPHRVHLDVRASGLHEPLVQEGPVPPDVSRVVRVELAALVVPLPEELLHPAVPRGDRVVDPHVVVLAVNGLLHEGLGNCRAVHRDGVLRLHEALWILPRHLLLPVVQHPDLRGPGDLDELGHGDELVGHDAVEEPPVLEHALKLDVVQAQKVLRVLALHEVHVGLGLIQGEPRREEGYEAVHLRPLLDGLV